MLKQKSAIGNNIKKYQNKLGIFQDALSRRKNLAFHAIVKIEAGSTLDLGIETVIKSADALGMSLDDLYPMKYGEAVAMLFYRAKKHRREIIFFRIKDNLLEPKKIARLS